MRERLLADGHEEARDGRRDRRREHVLRDERGRVEVPPGRRASGALARARLRDRVCGEPRRSTRAARAERVGRRAAERGAPRRDRGRRGRDRLRALGRAPRADAGVRQDPGRLLVLVCVLRDPARARGDAEPARRRCARGDPAAHCSGPPRDRADRRQPRLLSRPRGRAHARVARPGRGRRCRGSSACGSRRSRSTTSRRSSSRRCARRRRRRGISMSRSSRATTASCAR